MPAGTTVLRLEEMRKRYGVSLEQISDRTKIGTQFLRAIETEEFEKLPGGVFNTSYIRQYAVAIGFSETVLLGQYALFANDPNLINTYIDRITKVTAADVQRVAKQYFVTTNRTVVITNPKPAAGQGGVQ